MGCCGHDFTSKEKIREAIQKNSLEFSKINPSNEKELLKFRDRAYRMNLRNGVCRNLIQKENQLFCPLHPAQNQGKELRENHCDINHLCQTSKEFKDWEEEKQKQFLEFVKKKKLDNLDYSLQMDNGILLKEFKSFE